MLADVRNNPSINGCLNAVYRNGLTFLASATLGKKIALVAVPVIGMGWYNYNTKQNLMNEMHDSTKLFKLREFSKKKSGGEVDSEGECLSADSVELVVNYPLDLSCFNIENFGRTHKLYSLSTPEDKKWTELWACVDSKLPQIEESRKLIYQDFDKFLNAHNTWYDMFKLSGYSFEMNYNFIDHMYTLNARICQ